MATATQTYQGWTNYETWCVKLWMDNDEGLYLMVRDLIAERDGIYELSEALKSMVSDYAPDLEGMYADLLRAAIQAANYYEIAENMIEDED